MRLGHTTGTGGNVRTRRAQRPRHAYREATLNRPPSTLADDLVNELQRRRRTIERFRSIVETNRTGLVDIETLQAVLDDD